MTLTKTTTRLSLAALAFAFLSFVPLVAEAKSVQVGLPNFHKDDRDYFYSGCIPSGPQWLDITSALIYSADIYSVDASGVETLINDGSYFMNGVTYNSGFVPSVPVGTHLRLKPKPYADTDISWFATGGSNDSPYGSWSLGAIYTGKGEVYILISDSDCTIDSTFSIAVNPPVPQYSFGGTATYSCTDPANCTVTGAGTIQASVTFPQTAVSEFDVYPQGSVESPGGIQIAPPVLVYSGPVLSIYPLEYHLTTNNTLCYPDRTTNTIYCFNATTGNTVSSYYASTPLPAYLGTFQAALELWSPPLLPQVFSSERRYFVHDLAHPYDWIKRDYIYVDGTVYIDGTGKYLCEYYYYSPIDRCAYFLSPVVNKGLLPASGDTSSQYPNQPGTVSAQTIPFTLTAVDWNNPPTAPTITGPASANIASPQTFTFSATDPDAVSRGDTVRYGIDWNNDGTVDEYVPASGFVPSGTTQSATHSMPLSGYVYYFEARAEDNRGGISYWSPYSVAINPAVNGSCGAASGTTLTAAPTSGLCYDGTPSAVSGSGPWTWSCASTNGGTTASCSASASCTKTNACGSSNFGIVTGGTCSVSAPANPLGYGTACSVSNSCGMTTTGMINCTGSCVNTVGVQVSAPSNSLCTPPPAPTLDGLYQVDPTTGHDVSKGTNAAAYDPSGYHIFAKATSPYQSTLFNSTLTYYFEWSTDGVTWTSIPGTWSAVPMQ